MHLCAVHVQQAVRKSFRATVIWRPGDRFARFLRDVSAATRAACLPRGGTHVAHKPPLRSAECLREKEKTLWSVHGASPSPPSPLRMPYLQPTATQRYGMCLHCSLRAVGQQ
jgi:hypothetical protein